jgi:ceroid-lipofuscinosis MFS transporter 7
LWKYSTIVAINPLAQVIFSPIFGYFYNKFGAVRPLGVISAIVFIFGNLLYSILSLIPSENGRYGALLLSRFLTGASSGRFSTDLHLS